MISPQPVACSLTSPELRQRLDHLRTTLFANARSMHEDACGFTFLFENTEAHVDSILDVVRLERQCCPFLHFHIDIAPEPAMLELRLNGTDEAREFIVSTFVPLIPDPGDDDGHRRRLAEGPPFNP